MGRSNGVFLDQKLQEEENPGKLLDAAAGKQNRSLHTAGVMEVRKHT